MLCQRPISIVPTVWFWSLFVVHVSLVHYYYNCHCQDYRDYWMKMRRRISSDDDYATMNNHWRNYSYWSNRFDRHLYSLRNSPTWEYHHHSSSFRLLLSNRMNSNLNRAYWSAGWMSMVEDAIVVVTRNFLYRNRGLMTRYSSLLLTTRDRVHFWFPHWYSTSDWSVGNEYDDWASWVFRSEPTRIYSNRHRIHLGEKTNRNRCLWTVDQTTWLVTWQCFTKIFRMCKIIFFTDETIILCQVNFFSGIHFTRTNTTFITVEMIQLIPGAKEIIALNDFQGTARTTSTPITSKNNNSQASIDCTRCWLSMRLSPPLAFSRSEAF